MSEIIYLQEKRKVYQELDQVARRGFLNKEIGKYFKNKVIQYEEVVKVLTELETEIEEAEPFARLSVNSKKKECQRRHENYKEVRDFVWAHVNWNGEKCNFHEEITPVLSQIDKSIGRLESGKKLTGVAYKIEVPCCEF